MPDVMARRKDLRAERLTVRRMHIDDVARVVRGRPAALDRRAMPVDGNHTPPRLDPVTVAPKQCPASPRGCSHVAAAYCAAPMVASGSPEYERAARARAGTKPTRAIARARPGPQRA